MKKLGSICAVLLLTLVLLLVVMRFALGLLIGTEGVKNLVNTEIERALQRLLPTLITETGSVELSGVADLELHQLRIQNGQQLEGAFVLVKTRIHPHWSSLWRGSDWRLNAVTLTSGDGRLDTAVAWPRTLLADKPNKTPLRLTGTAVKIDARRLAQLFLSEKAAAGLGLEQGLISGGFELTTTRGAQAQSAGRFNGKLEAAVWSMAASASRPQNAQNNPGERLPDINFNLEMDAGKIVLRRPVALTSKRGHGELSGELLLPQQSVDEPSWNLRVLVADDTGLAAALATAFHCQSPPQAARYLVQGNVGSPKCTAEAAPP